jgi:hypothetical protein
MDGTLSPVPQFEPLPRFCLDQLFVGQVKLNAADSLNIKSNKITINLQIFEYIDKTKLIEESSANPKELNELFVSYLRVLNGFKLPRQLNNYAIGVK